MTTRSFLKSMLLAAVAPQVLIAAAEDRYRWKFVPDANAPLSYDPKALAGSWRFIEYKLQNGIWTRKGTGIIGEEVCDPPERFFGERVILQVHVSPNETWDGVFHKRES